MKFRPDEDARGRQALRAMGLPPEAQFVCVHSRDKAYLDQAHPYFTREQWAYHDYRDCDIANYLPAARALSAKGLYALRMGSIIEKQLGDGDPRIVDYATRFRSDFLDIWLPANCKFFLGCTAGLVNVPLLFNVPVAAANYVPLGFASFRAGDIFIPKTYRDARGVELPFRRIVENGAWEWTDGRQFAQANIEVVENSTEDISALADEMDARLDGRWKPEPGDEKLQLRFRELFPKDHPMRHFPSRVGAAFLRRHEGLL